LAKSKFFDDKYNLANVLFNIGLLHRIRAEYAQAEAAYNESLSIYEELGYDDDIAETYLNLGALYAATEDYDRAEEKYNKALDMHRIQAKDDTNFEYHVAIALHNLGRLHKNTHRYEQAEREFNEALEIFRKFEDDNPKHFKEQEEAILHFLAEIQQAKEANSGLIK
jgi:tetratricopeptide (TPR) repeat protein